MRSYNIRDLTNIAQYNKFNRDTLEKVLRLSELLKLFDENEEFKVKDVLKGGTAINLCPLRAFFVLNSNVKTDKKSLLNF